MIHAVGPRSFYSSAAEATLRLYCVDAAHNALPSVGFIQPLSEGDAMAAGVRTGGQTMWWEGTVEPYALLHLEIVRSPVGESGNSA